MILPATNKTLRYHILVLLLLIAGPEGYSQSKRADHWAFPLRNALDFSTTPPTTYNSAIGGSVLSKNTSTMSDEDGDLLFYSNGEKAWTRNHTLMPNGNNLAGGNEATQNSIIIPSPYFSDRYFLFTQAQTAGAAGLNYYTVDMSFNGGFGDILGSAVQLQDTMTEKLCAVKHADDYSYWVVAHEWLTDSFYAYKVDSFGVSAPVISEAGMRHGGTVNGVMGQMKISPDGTRLALASWARGFIQLFDFDAATGVVSNPITLVHYLSNFPYGIEFSPDSRKLYYTQRFSGADPNPTLYQFDLDHINVDCLIDSKTEIFEFNPLKVPSSLQLGRDGKIYMGVNYFPTYDTLAVINSPNLLGADCGFEEYGLLADSLVVEGLTSVVSSYVSDGIHVVFGSTCDGDSTWMFPEDSLALDSVRWDFGDTSSVVNTSTQVYTSHFFSSADTFLVTLYAYEGGTADTFYRHVIIWDTTYNLLGNDTTICNTGSVPLHADWHNSCLEWSTGSTSSSITVNSEGWYWVDVYHQSCYFRDSIFVDVVSGPPQFSLGDDTLVCENASFLLDPELSSAFYTWQDGSHDTTYLVTTNGTYALTATNACGATSDTVNVILNPSPALVLNFPPDTTVCINTSIFLDVTLADAVYEWSDGSTSSSKTITAPGTYWVKVATICDTVSDTIDVFFDTPLVSLLNDVELLCSPEDTLKLYATDDTAEVLWSTGTTAAFEYFTTAGTIWFRDTNTCGSLSDTSQLLMWDTAYHIELGEDSIVCSDANVITLGDTQQLYPFSYHWSNEEKTPVIQIHAGTFSLTATNHCASISDTIAISVAEQVNIIAPPQAAICEDETLHLRINQLFTEDVKWSTGEITTAIEITAAGIYDVKVTDTNGCTFLDTVVFSSECPGKVFVPNVFTPNGDGLNDFFCPVFKNITDFTMVIYNRWGMEVFDTTEKRSCWDGRMKGDGEASRGTYFYTIDARDSSGQSVSFRGSFTLVR